MAIAYRTLLVRSARRIRLVFDAAVGAGAFSTSFYSVQSLDGIGADPPVAAALVVPDSPTVVELALAIPLAPGGRYELSVAAGVPALDASLADEASEGFLSPEPQPPPSPELSADETFDTIYGLDVVFEDDDFVEDASGDLVRRGGIENVKAAAAERALSAGLPWDPSYGPNLRRFVDGSDAELPSAATATASQLLADDRVKSVKSKLEFDDDGTAFINLSLKLVGDVDQSIAVRPE